MSATGQVPQRGVRHPITVVMRARALHEAEWQPAAIARILATETGTPVSRATVGRWVKPVLAERHRVLREQGNRARAAGRSGRLADHIHGATPEFKLARVRALRARRVTIASIARVMSFDFEPVSEAQIRRALETGRYPTRRAT